MRNIRVILPFLAIALAGASDVKATQPGRKPTGDELRNPADPIQGERIAAAARKRAMRAAKLAKKP